MMSLFDRLGNRITEYCVVIDCYRNSMFVITSIYVPYSPHGVGSYTRVDVLRLDAHGDMTRWRDSVFFNGVSNLKSRQWELIREVDYVPF